VTDYPIGLTSLTLSALLNEIHTTEPIAAYTVDFMSFDLTTVLSQHTIALTIVYRHEERPRILSVRGRRGLEQAVWAALTEYHPLLTVEMNYYHVLDHDAEEMVRSFYYSHPDWAAELPEVNISLYPSQGDSLHRIVELELVWQTPAEELRQKSKEAVEAALQILSEMPVFFGSSEEQTAQEVLWLHDALSQAAAHAPDNSEPQGNPHTAYGALVNGPATGEGYAMAFKLLCDMLDIGCIVVPGSRLGEDDAWNLVKIGEEWYHLSVSLNNRGLVTVYDFFLIGDEAAEESLQWDRSLFPPAGPGPWTVEALRGLAG
jgi:hypothetical protein